MAYTTINKSGDYFNTKLYTGNSSTNNITGVGFQPDWVWLKDRDSAEYHNVFDIVRGITANRLYPNSTTTTDGYDPNALQSFDSDGFTLGSGGAYNNSGNNFASWNWLASNTTASNTDGSITSTVSANTTSGFSIVSYTGTGANATVGHGLGVAPSMIIFKRLTGSGWDWIVYHKSMGNNYSVSLNLTNAKSNTSSSTYFQDTTPTSSVFSIGNSGHLNGDDIIAYCFAEVPGYSKFGSYEGNQSADGTFVYTGFKPAFVLSKDIDGAGENWFIHDNKRNSFNPTNTYLRPNLNSAEGTAHHYDFHSNGFKNRYAGGSLNSSGRTYIYMAFAEAPLVGSNNVPCTAR